MRFLCFSAKIVFAPPGVGFGGLKGVDVDNDETGIDSSPYPPSPIALNLEMNTARACLSLSNLTLI